MTPTTSSRDRWVPCTQSSHISRSRLARSACPRGRFDLIDTTEDVLGLPAVKPLRSGTVRQLISAGSPKARSLNADRFARKDASASADICPAWTIQLHVIMCFLPLQFAMVLEVLRWRGASRLRSTPSLRHRDDGAIIVAGARRTL